MELRGLVFNEDGKFEKYPLRSRIKENFTVDDCEMIHNICLSNRFSDNNEKADVLFKMLVPRGFQELGAGTNRYAMFKDAYVFKFSLDHYGFDDNYTEFNMTKELQVYGATKTYETNGLICTGQYINRLTLKQFHANKERIRRICREMSKKYLFADLGTVDKNFLNWGWDDRDELRFLDYGYVFRRDPNLMYCTECGGRIGYDSDYNEMKCENCGTKFTVHDIKAMMNADDDTRREMFRKKKTVTVKVADSERDAKDETLMISVKKGGNLS